MFTVRRHVRLMVLIAIVHARRVGLNTLSSWQVLAVRIVHTERTILWRLPIAKVCVP